jgi:transcriptional regulator GlxA family with amidase domain
MNKKTIYLFLFDGYSDWEPSYVSVEINKSTTYHLQTFSIDNKPVKSSGGLTIQTDAVLTQVNPVEAEMIIIPGGSAWEQGKYREIIPLINELNKQHKAIAAICSGTLLLADAGLLDTINHTSNADFYLKKFSSAYKGAERYQQQPAVSDKNIITGGGVYPLEFAREIFAYLKLMDDAAIEKWFQLYKNGVWIG